MKVMIGPHWRRLVFLGGLAMLCQPSVANANLVITEVYANSPGSGQDAGKEWLELSNTSEDTAIDLDGATLQRLDGTARNQAWSLTLTGAPTLAPGTTLVLGESDDLGLGLCFAFEVFVLDSSFVLGNSGVQFLSIETADQLWGEEAVLNPSTFPDGQARERVDANETEDIGTAWAASSCELQTNVYGTPGQAPSTCLTEEDFLPSSECAGGGTPVVGTDGGVSNGNSGGVTTTSTLDGGGQIDVSGNAAPTGSLVIISSDGQSATFQLTATDADHMAVSGSLYYAVAQNQPAGQEIVAGLNLQSDGSPVEFVWEFGDVPEGTYYPFAVFSDSYGAKSYAYGTQAIQVGAQTAEMAFSITEPDGINDSASASAGLNIAWNILPAVDGVVALYYDTDGQGYDGEPIVSGLSANATGPRTYLWQPDESVPNGNYAIYGVISWAGNQAMAFPRIC